MRTTAVGRGGAATQSRASFRSRPAAGRRPTRRWLERTGVPPARGAGRGGLKARVRTAARPRPRGVDLRYPSAICAILHPSLCTCSACLPACPPRRRQCVHGCKQRAARRDGESGRGGASPRGRGLVWARVPRTALQIARRPGPAATHMIKSAECLHAPPRPGTRQRAARRTSCPQPLQAGSPLVSARLESTRLVSARLESARLGSRCALVKVASRRQSRRTRTCAAITGTRAAPRIYTPRMLPLPMTSVARLGHGWAGLGVSRGWPPGRPGWLGIYDSVAAKLAAHIDAECGFANFYWQTGFFFDKHT